MNAMFIFAFVVLLVMLVLLGFLIANVVYYNKIKNGTSLTSSQANSLFILNVIGLIIVVFIFFYAIFAAIRSRKYNVSTTTTVVDDDGVLVEAVQTTQTISAPAPVVAPVPVVAPAPVVASAVARPADAVPVARVPDGQKLFRLTRSSQLPAGAVCAFP